MISTKKAMSRAVAGCVFAFAASGAAHADPLKATVIHWWTSGGESAAIKQFADAYNKAGGLWVDQAVAGADQARSTAINRIMGGDPPTAAQFNTSKQFHDIIDQGLLNNVDDVVAKQNWDKIFPASIIESIKSGGHYYAAPVDIHMPAWFFYSKPAFQKAGISTEPATWDEFIADLDKLKAAGVIPPARGGQASQERITFAAVCGDVGAPDLYMKVY